VCTNGSIHVYISINIGRISLFFYFNIDVLYIKISMNFFGKSVHFYMWVSLRVIWNTKNKSFKGNLIYFHLKSCLSSTSELVGYTWLHVNGGTLLWCVCCIHNKVITQSDIISFECYFLNFFVLLTFKKRNKAHWTNKHTCQASKT